jgi:predicted DNA-binding transcriptional regulator YafY
VLIVSVGESAPATALVARLEALLAALRPAPLPYPELRRRLGDVYPHTDSARRMINRDIESLRLLGIEIERSPTRPPVYILRGGTPHYAEHELRALALLRDTFGLRHPQHDQVHALLERLTAQLDPDERRVYRRRQALRAPVEPAIDYTGLAELFDTLNGAIHTRQRLSFLYHSPRRARPIRHEQVEPLEIEFYDRHFYLVAYTPLGRQVLDFRIDRIQYDDTFRRLDYLPPEVLHERSPVPFRYRLAAEVARGGVSERFEGQRIVEQLPNGDVIIEAAGRSDFFIIQTLLRYRGNAELLEPGWLRAKMTEEVARMWAVYGGASGRESEEGAD